MEQLRHQLTGRLHYHFLTYFDLTLGGKYEKRINSNDYFLLAARLSATINHFQFYLDADNLTDVTYTEVAAVPLPGRWVSLGVKYRL